MKNNNLALDDQASGLRQITQTDPVHVIAVTAGKGGVGKTSVSVNLSLALAEKNKKVLLLDADLGLANVDVMLGLHAKYDLSHVLEGQCNINDIILEGPGGIQIIPSSSGTEKMASLSVVEHAGIINAFNEVTDSIDYLIVDTAAGISDTVLSFTRSSQEIILVVCDEPTSITDAYALIKVMNKRYGTRHFHILTNMTRSEKDGRDLFAKLYCVTEQFLDVNLEHLGDIPYENLAHKSAKKQKAILQEYPSCPMSRQFNKVAEKVCQWPRVKNIKGNTSFFIERLVGCS